MLAFNQIIDTYSRINPSKIVINNESKKLSYRMLKINGTNLAFFFKKIGISKGDRVALLAYNCIEYAEALYATSKIGAIIVPINFRLDSHEIIALWNDAKPKCLVFQEYFSKVYYELVRNKLIRKKQCIAISKSDKDFNCNLYYKILKNKISSIVKLKQNSKPEDIWSLMYTSGTTGTPKGVARNHSAYYILSFITAIELSIKKEDMALLVMPLCHANSFNFFCAYIFSGASVCIYSKKSFEPELFFKLIENFRCTFTSLVPTHYIILLEYIKKNKNMEKYKIENNFSFMISSAPVRADTKKDILKYFNNARLFELYGSSESGWVTMLHPSDQLSRLGTVGKECVGSKPILILNEKKKEVKDQKIGELYASTPYNFSFYWNSPSKTKKAFFNDYVTVGDLAYRTKDGYIKLVDRKKNMIISGGENIYPAEVENVLGNHKKINDIAVIGDADKKWGEVVCAFVVLKEGCYISEKDLINWAKSKLARYKCPKRVIFINHNQMPRNATGKVLHKELKIMIKKYKNNE